MQLPCKHTRSVSKRHINVSHLTYLQTHTHASSRSEQKVRLRVIINSQAPIELTGAADYGLMHVMFGPIWCCNALQMHVMLHLPHSLLSLC